MFEALDVNGHVHFNGTIVVNVGSRVPTGEIIIMHYNSSSGSPQIIVNVEPEECTIVTTTPQQREKHYAVLFSVQQDTSPECLDDEGDNNWMWIVIGVSIGVVVIAASIGAFIFMRKKFATI
jgi:type 1 fimbria pilin